MKMSEVEKAISHNNLEFMPPTQAYDKLRQLGFDFTFDHVHEAFIKRQLTIAKLNNSL